MGLRVVNWRKLAKKLAGRLDTLISDKRVSGEHAGDNSKWCRNTETLIRKARKN